VQTKTVSAHTPRRAALLAGAALALLVGTGTARAFEYQLGDWQVSLDTTLTSNVEVRTSPVDYNFVGYANGGRYPTANADNGDLNFGKAGDVVGATQRVTTEFQAKNGDTGIFVRATGFYDPIYSDDTNDFRFPLSRAAVRDVGNDFRLLDAYFFARPEIGDHPVDVRIGNQALNWGESTFIQFGINSITPLDTTALHIPGSELRTAFLPIPVVDLKTEIVPDLTIEGFWQPYWTRTKIDPSGSFFSTNDGVGDGGLFQNFFSVYPDNLTSIQRASLADSNPFGGSFPRSLDRHPTTMGEFGFALRDTLSSMGDTEIGLYYENYSSRTPFVSFRTGSKNISAGVGLPGTTVLPDPALSFLFGLPFPGQPLYYKTYSDTDSYFADYPDDIHLAGFSWSFTGPAGVAIQGEVSHRFNQPLQLAGADEALAINAPAICDAGAVSPLLAAACTAAHNDPVIQALGGVPKFNS
jgi:hypothetical protein